MCACIYFLPRLQRTSRSRRSALKCAACANESLQALLKVSAAHAVAVSVSLSVAAAVSLFSLEFIKIFTEQPDRADK